MSHRADAMKNREVIGFSVTRQCEGWRIAEKSRFNMVTSARIREKSINGRDYSNRVDDS
jgi:hypothetical protein